MCLLHQAAVYQSAFEGGYLWRFLLGLDQGGSGESRSSGHECPCSKLPPLLDPESHPDLGSSNGEGQGETSGAKVGEDLKGVEDPSGASLRQRVSAEGAVDLPRFRQGDLVEMAAGLDLHQRNTTEAATGEGLRQGSVVVAMANSQSLAHLLRGGLEVATTQSGALGGDGKVAATSSDSGRGVRTLSFFSWEAEVVVRRR